MGQASHAYLSLLPPKRRRQDSFVLACALFFRFSSAIAESAGTSGPESNIIAQEIIKTPREDTKKKQEIETFMERIRRIDESAQLSNI